MSFGRFVTPPLVYLLTVNEACRPTRASHAGWPRYADLTPDESTKAARGAEAGWRGRWWRMYELQTPGARGAVYQHHGKAQRSPSLRSKRASQGKSQAPARAQRQRGSGRQADSRATERQGKAGNAAGLLQPSRRHASGVVGVSACRMQHESPESLPLRTDVDGRCNLSQRCSASSLPWDRLNAQSNGERQCSPHLPHHQTRGWGLRHHHRRLPPSPPCAILRDLEHSNRSAASIGMHHARIRPSRSSLPVNETNQMLARHASPASVRASHPSNHPSPAPTPGSIAICLLSHLPRSHSVPFVQHRNLSISFHPASTLHTYD
jgi:hypothetical protein